MFVAGGEGTGVPCYIECAVYSGKKALRQYCGAEWIAPKEDPEWVNMSGGVWLTPAG